MNLNKILKILICCSDHESRGHRYRLHRWILCHVLSMSVIMRLLLSRYRLHRWISYCRITILLTFRIPISPSKVDIILHHILVIFGCHSTLNLGIYNRTEGTELLSVQLLFSHGTLSLFNTYFLYVDNRYKKIMELVTNLI